MNKAAIAATVAGILTSPALRDLRRGAAGWRRRLGGGAPVVHYFHDPADPYSHLAVQMLVPLAARYRITIAPHLVSPPDAAAAPEADKLAGWGRRDAALLARSRGLAFPPEAAQPEAASIARCASVLAQAITDGAFPSVAAEAGAALWQGGAAFDRWVAERPVASKDATTEAIAQGDDTRRRLRHYLGATFYFESEWFWGIDRLHHLERRLAAMGLDTRAGDPPLMPVKDVTLAGLAGAATGRVLHMFLSLRSPYTYIAVPRARALARHYGAELRLRFVLPMVMRGLPVSGPKRMYITLDTKREAERLGLPFGKIVDPVGPGVERGLAVLHHAIAAGLGEAFVQSFLQGVWADGIDSVSDAGLHAIAERAGVSIALVRDALADASWRDVAEANRAELFAAGLWGVPCFRVDNGPMVWGQDRLWAVEEALRKKESTSF